MSIVSVAVVSEGCRVGDSGVDAFVSGAVVSGSIVLGDRVRSSNMVEYVVARGMSCWWPLCRDYRVGDCGVGELSCWWLLCRGVRVGCRCVRVCRVGMSSVEVYNVLRGGEGRCN